MSGSKSIYPSATSFVQKLLSYGKIKDPEDGLFEGPFLGVGAVTQKQHWKWVQNYFAGYGIGWLWGGGYLLQFYTPSTEWKKWVDDFNQMSEVLEVPVRAHIELLGGRNDISGASAVVEISVVHQGRTFFSFDES